MRDGYHHICLKTKAGQKPLPIGPSNRQWFLVCYVRYGRTVIDRVPSQHYLIQLSTVTFHDFLRNTVAFSIPSRFLTIAATNVKVHEILLFDNYTRKRHQFIRKLKKRKKIICILIYFILKRRLKVITAPVLHQCFND
jgi:hypothetical protein